MKIKSIVLALTALFVGIEPAKADGWAQVGISDFSGTFLFTRYVTNGESGFAQQIELPPGIYYFNAGTRASSQNTVGGSESFRTSLALTATFSQPEVLPESFLHSAATNAGTSNEPDDNKIARFNDFPFAAVFQAGAHGNWSHGVAQVDYRGALSNGTLSLNGASQSGAWARTSGYTYGEASYGTNFSFTVTSTTVVTLTGSISAGGHGTSQQFPVLPSDGVGTFINVPTEVWLDPPMASGYAFKMTGASLFTGIAAFPQGIDADDEFEVWSGGVSLGKFHVGQEVNFVALLGAGVGEFSVTGIDPAVDSENPLAFPIKLRFNTSLADLTMLPILVPELSGLSLIPANGPQPTRFTATVSHGHPNGTARLQATTDLSAAGSWTEIGSFTFDATGTVTITEAPDTRPNAALAERVFFRVISSPPVPVPQ